MSRTHGPELSEIIEIAKEAALAAGRIQRERFGDPGQLDRKGGLELVTEVDLACEAAILETIGATFPTHSILAEEGGDHDHGSPHRWIIDPLDGTTNFAHGFPVFGSSVAYAREGVVLAGACALPMWDQLFWGLRGQGAFLNGRRLRVSREPDLGESLLATGFPYDLRTSDVNNLEEFVRVHRRARGVRRAGAAVVDLCVLAAGGFDGFWELKLRPWDTAAAALFVEEAGGRVTDLGGGPWDPFLPEIVATNGRIHDQLLAVLGEG